MATKNLKAAVIDYAAFLVYNKWCIDFYSLVEREKISVTLTIISEIIKVPHMADPIIKILPIKVDGERSPYPTVVIEITMHHIAEK